MIQFPHLYLHNYRELGQLTPLSLQTYGGLQSDDVVAQQNQKQIPARIHKDNNTLTHIMQETSIPTVSCIISECLTHTFIQIII